MTLASLSKQAKACIIVPRLRHGITHVLYIQTIVNFVDLSIDAVKSEKRFVRYRWREIITFESLCRTMFFVCFKVTSFLVINNNIQTKTAIPIGSSILYRMFLNLKSIDWYLLIIAKAYCFFGLYPSEIHFRTVSETQETREVMIMLQASVSLRHTWWRNSGKKLNIRNRTWRANHTRK